MIKLTGIIALLIMSSISFASAPVGIYAKVSDVKITTKNGIKYAKVSGTFRMAIGTSRNSSHRLSPPQKGFFYYACPVQKQRICDMEWKDLENAANSNYCVGFARRGGVTGVLRLPNWKAEHADQYPIQMGVSHVTCSVFKTRP